jgi:phosphoglycerol transferase MdoB-like AlkP superfamily enzyme
LLSCVSRLRSIRIALRLVLISALLITAIDLLVTHELWTRLTATELLEFMGELGAVSGFLQQLLSSNWALFATVLAVGLVLTVFVRYLRDDRPSVTPVFLYLLIGVGVVGCELVETREYHDAYLQNSIEVFFSRQTGSIPYSKEFVKSLPVRSLEGQSCDKAHQSRSDVILVVVESLSMYQSALFSGINDWMPEFDAISKTGVRFSNFYANGVTSEQGLVSLLTGEPPIAKGKEAKTLFEQFRNPVQTVPRMLHGMGYDTVFLTTGNLGFVGKGKWLKDIGFDVIEGHESPAYKGLKRYQFDAAPDGALYDRALAELQVHKTAPTFMALETVSTHMPNVDPETGAHSQELTYRYADRQLGKFVRSLQSSGFLEHGTLIITADHRAMVPMSLKERTLYCDRGFVRIPLTVVGTGLVEREETAGFSQTDLLPSLRNAMGAGAQCVGANQGIFLPTVEHKPKCIYTNRSYEVNDVFVHCGAEDFTIELNGDETQFLAAQSPPPGVLPELHSLRLGQGFR